MDEVKQIIISALKEKGIVVVDLEVIDISEIIVVTETERMRIKIVRDV